MNWTERTPSEEGHFWYYEPEFDILDTVRVYRDPGHELLIATGSMIESRRVEAMAGKWAGPIDPPDLDRRNAPSDDGRAGVEERSKL